MAERTYLGYVVGGGYVKPEINKLEAEERELSSAKKQKGDPVIPWTHKFPQTLH